MITYASQVASYVARGSFFSSQTAAIQVWTVLGVMTEYTRAPIETLRRRYLDRAGGFDMSSRVAVGRVCSIAWPQGALYFPFFYEGNCFTTSSVTSQPTRATRRKRKDKKNIQVLLLSFPKNVIRVSVHEPQGGRSSTLCLGMARSLPPAATAVPVKSAPAPSWSWPRSHCSARSAARRRLARFRSTPRYLCD